MNRKSLGMFLLASSLIAIIGCSEQSPSGTNNAVTLNPESGRFGISSLGKLEKRTAGASVLQGAQVKFNLGKIKGSSGFFFLLYNVGMTPITNVSLSTDNPAFSVFPSSMDTLIPGSDVGMLPVVKIAAFHGTPYDGVGNRPLLPQGTNQCILHIQGTSKTSGGTDTVIALDAVMNLEALVMDLSLDAMNGPMDISKTLDMSNPSEVSRDFQFIKELRSLVTSKTECLGDSVITLRNTGNVPLHCMVYRSLYEKSTNSYLIDTVVDSSITAQNDMDIILNGAVESVAYLIAVSGNNAVADPSKVFLNENGTFYARIVKGTLPCQDAQVIARYEQYLRDRAQNNCSKIWAFVDNRLIAYTENYNNGDSIVAVLYDLFNDQLVTSYTGQGHILYQTNDYTGAYLNDFATIITAMFMNDSKTFDLSPGRITGSGQSNWGSVTREMIKFVNWTDGSGGN